MYRFKGDATFTLTFSRTYSLVQLDSIRFNIFGFNGNSTNSNPLPTEYHQGIVFESCRPLPVELSRFEATATPPGIRLSWTTASERDNQGFIVERSLTGTTFERLADVRGNGTTSSVSHYEHLDTRPVAALAYYRLKQVDRSGSVSYSPVRQVSSKTTTREVFYRNRDADAGYAFQINGTDEPVSLSLLNMQGRSMAAFLQPQDNTLSFNVPNGIYFLVVHLRSGKHVQQRISLNR